MTNNNSAILDALFKKGSKARKTAELILSGESYTRKELAQKVGVSETTIPRVVNALEEAGVEIETRTDKSRHVTYTATSWGHLRAAAGDLPMDVMTYYGPVSGEPVMAEVTESEKVRGEWIVEVKIGGYRFRGSISTVNGRPIPSAIITGGEVVVMGMIIFEGGQWGFRLADEGGAVDFRSKPDRK